jgi:thiamine-monophosphate kinase
LTVSELGERALLARIRARLPRPDNRVAIGIGDDAAVVITPRNARTVLTTDALVEGVHFERRFSSAADIGFKAMAVNLSDLAGMGAQPAWALLSLALPDGTLVEDVEALTDGLATAANAESVAVIGGNLTRSPGPMVVDVTAVGTVLPRRVLRRDSGRPGDELYVSHTIGRGAAGLEMLQVWATDPAAQDVGGACVAHYRRPEARVRLGRALAQARAARAAMDLSDGLADAVRQVAEASGCGAEIDAGLLPIDEDARRWWVSRGEDVVARALSGGDDFELLIAVPPSWRGRLRHARRRVAQPALTRIGVLTRNRGEYAVVHEGRREPLPGGFEHW